ncbi:MAG: radical SAM protein [Planctomycetes bacterium]|nr:radical SAM protein [Planctomycetota bacterium]
MANLGYIQVVRHCNHYCGFCSNPKTEYHFSFDEIRAIIDDFVARGYYGIILTGGEPSLSPILPDVIRYARTRTSLHVRMITNGWRLADPAFCARVAEAGLSHVHVSVYSVRPEVEEALRGVPNPLERSFAALANLGAHQPGVTVNVNCVINSFNADHLDENVRVLTERFPFVRHFVWNNLDPSMGRAQENRQYVPRLAAFERSLRRAMDYLTATGRTFRVERVPLCYMAEYAHCSTETRKIVKSEERIVHFLDEKGMVRQTDWGHRYGEVCDACPLRPVCGGLFDRGDAYDVAELAPVFMDPDDVRRNVWATTAPDEMIAAAAPAGNLSNLAGESAPATGAR